MAVLCATEDGPFAFVDAARPLLLPPLAERSVAGEYAGGGVAPPVLTALVSVAVAEADVIFALLVSTLDNEDSAGALDPGDDAADSCADDKPARPVSLAVERSVGPPCGELASPPPEGDAGAAAPVSVGALAVAAPVSVPIELPEAA